MMPRLLLAFALTALSGSALAQEELLWKVENPVSATLVPAYQGWGSIFTPKEKQKAAPAVTSSEEARAQAEAEARAQAEAMAAMAQREKADKEAKQKAEKLTSGADIIVADLSSIKLEGILQGPLGNSVLFQGKWLKTGSQLGVPRTTSDKFNQIYTKLQATDALAAGYVTEKMAQRMTTQTTISVTLVQVNSNTAVFSDGRRQYKLQLSQPPL